MDWGSLLRSPIAAGRLAVFLLPFAATLTLNCAPQKAKAPGTTQLEDFDYSIVHGPGDRELDFHLRDKGTRVEMIRRPATATVEGAIIGTFRGPASPAFIAALRTALTKLAPPPSSLEMRPDTAVIVIRYGQNIHFSVPYGAPESQAVTNGIGKLVRDEAARLERESAYRAIQVECLGLAPSGKAVKVRLHNPGTQPVELDWKAEPILTITGSHKSGPWQRISKPGAVTGALPATIPPKSSGVLEVPVDFGSGNVGEWQVRAHYEVESASSGPEAGQVGGAALSKKTTVQVR